MKNDIINRLDSLSYTVKERDNWLIGFIIDKVTNTIKNKTNTKEIPAGLRQIAIDMACGEFLKSKKASGDLDGFNIDIDAVMLSKQSQGDTSVSFAVDKTQSAEERLDALIEHLLNYGKSELMRFRRFIW